MNLNPTKRFSDRVDNYVKYRPTYPKEIIDFLTSELGLTRNSIVVDVGSGTGISSELFLKNENVVYGVEPNDNMRMAAEQTLASYSNFRSCKGTSEATGLQGHMADFIVAAQAFHWFEPKATRTEFERILKPEGYVALIWNDRKTSGSPFAEAYEALINEFGTDYKQVKHKNVDEGRIENFLGAHQVRHFYNHQEFDFDGLLGRLTSSSYAPNVGHPRFDEMRLALKRLFERYNVNGRVKIEYDTQIFYSRLRPSQPQKIPVGSCSTARSR